MIYICFSYNLKIFPLAYSNSGIEKPTQEEAKEILSKLKKLNEELKN